MLNNFRTVVGKSSQVIPIACAAMLCAATFNVHAYVPNINDHTSVVPSVFEGGTGDSATSTGASSSGDGRFVVFSSFASDLVPVDKNGLEDVFLFDRQTNLVTMVSRAADGTSGNGPSRGAVISADGTTIAFESSATNLFNDNNGGVQDVVIFNRVTKTFDIANQDDPGNQSDFPASNPSLSADGRFVAFDTTSALVAEAVNGSSGVYVRDLFKSTTQLVSRTPSGAFPNQDSTDPAISADGNFVAFVSRATDITSGAANVANIFYINRNTLVTQLVSVNGNADSSRPAMSGNGAVVGFDSEATSLVNLDFNSSPDAFVWTSATNSVELISRLPSGESPNGGSFDVSLNEDGNLVLFRSGADILVGGDSNGADDIFLLNRNEGSVTRINVAEDGTQADSAAFNPGLSPDGNTVVFWSNASTLSNDDAPNNTDVFIRNLGMAVPQPEILASVLPSSRSAQVNEAVTIFATMVATEIGNECRIELASPIDASLSFQRTDPQTNQLIGLKDQPVYLRPGVPMSFAISLTAFSPIEPQEVQFGFVCNTGFPAPVLITTNTLFFSASTVPVLDIVALSATINNDGIVNIQDAENFGVFSAANVNLGAPGNVTASLVVIGDDVDEALLCPTVFETGACFETPSESTLIFLGENGTSSFGIFVRSSTPIAFEPDRNRVMLIFTDDNGVIRGRTSVAISGP